MTSLADRTIATLRTNRDELAAIVEGLTDEQLSGPSGATEWDVAQVLAHLGSGAEIAAAGLRSTLVGEAVPEQSFNASVWDRWNAMSPREKAVASLEHTALLVSAFEALTSEQREGLQMKLGFLPSPLPLAAVAGMRLNEAALHSWDVRVALDPAATLAPEEATLLAEHLSGDVGFLLGFIGKADALSEPAAVALEGSGYGISVSDAVALTEAPVAPTATMVGPLEAAVRLLGGRLAPQHTPSDVVVTGNVTLDDLRRVFPGF